MNTLVTKLPLHMFCVLQHITNENTYFRNVPFWCLLQKVRTEGDLTNNPDQCTFISQLRETRPRMAALLSRQSQLPQNLLLQPIVLGKQPGVGTVPSSKCQEAWRWWQPACWSLSDSDTHHVFFLWVGAAFCLVWPSPSSGCRGASGREEGAGRTGHPERGRWGSGPPPGAASLFPGSWRAGRCLHLALALRSGWGSGSRSETWAECIREARMGFDVGFELSTRPSWLTCKV